MTIAASISAATAYHTTSGFCRTAPQCTRKAHYDISKEIKSIRPTIYLVDEGVYVDEETGQPDFTQIKDFTLNLLEEVKQEYNGHEEIEEL